MTLSATDWVHLNELLDEALDLEPARRLQWANSLALENSALSGVLRDLMQRSQGPETSEILLGAPLLTASSCAAVTSGDLVGPYRLIHELGAGGTATVWLAERADGSLRRQVALKLPRTGWLDRRLAQRLDRERDILASLEHPSIARLYDAGLDAAGRPYLALEYIEGVPLDRYAAERSLCIPGRLELFIQVARAVAFAHARLIVHRDLKPSNILVKSNGEISLLDFGIARLLQPESLHDLHLTRVGARALTPQYAAPEQFTNQPITVSTDVYSLGVLLYWLLADKSPYELRRESMAELEEAIVNRDPAPLTRGMPRKQARLLRGDLEMIVRKAMSKRPEHRYETVNAFLEDVERHQKHLPVRAQPERYIYQMRKFVARHTLPVIAAGVTSTAVVLGLSAALWQMEVRQAEAKRAERIKSFIASIFTQAVPRQGLGGVVTASDLLQAANKRVDAELGDDRGDKSELQIMIGASFLALDEPARALPVLRGAIENCAMRGAMATQCKQHAAMLLADGLQRTRDSKGGLSVLQEHRPADAPVGSEQAEIAVAGHRLRGVLLCENSFHDDALASLLKARALAERMLGPDHPETLGVLAATAEFYQRMPDRGDALAAAEEAMRKVTVSRAHLRPDIVLAQVERIYANALYAAGHGAAAEPILRRMLADQRLLDPSDTSRLADGEWVLADVLNSQGRLDEAIPLLRHSVDVDQNYLTNGADIRRRLLVLGAAYAGVRLPDEALQVAARWEEAARTADAEPIILRHRNVLVRAYALVHSGRWSEAERSTRMVREQSDDPAQRIETLVIDAMSARLQGHGSRAGQLAHQIVAASDKAELTPVKRAAYLSEAAASLLAAKETNLARQVLENARASYADAGVVTSIRMSDLILTDAQLRLMSPNSATENELRTLADAWRRANPDSVWHAEVLYWLARIQQMQGSAEARDHRQTAMKILRQSAIPALRALAEA